jgi:hypothetical protein
VQVIDERNPCYDDIQNQRRARHQIRLNAKLAHYSQVASCAAKPNAGV